MHEADAAPPISHRHRTMNPKPSPGLPTGPPPPAGPLKAAGTHRGAGAQRGSTNLREGRQPYRVVIVYEDRTERRQPPLSALTRALTSGQRSRPPPKSS